MKDAPWFKQSHKASDLCETCETGKVAKERYEHLQRELGSAGCERERRLQLEGELSGLKSIVENFDRHYACKEEQRNAFKLQRSSLANGEGLVVLDFKENIVIGSGPRELNAAFYSKSPRTLLGFVIFTMEDGVLRKRYVNILSDVLSHDSGFVVHSFRKVLDLSFVSSLKKLLVWSDCGPHFRCKEFCHFLFKEIPSRCTQIAHIEWNLFAERHGKSCCDSHFSLLSRWKREIENHVSINDTRTLIAEWMRMAAGSSVDMQFIEINSGQFTRGHIHTLEVEGKFKDYLRFESRGNSILGASSFNGALKLIETQERRVVDTRKTKQAFSRATTSTSKAQVHLCQAICTSTGRQCDSKGKVQQNGVYLCGKHKEGDSRFKVVNSQSDDESQLPPLPEQPLVPLRRPSPNPAPSSAAPQQRRVPPGVSILSLPPPMTMVHSNWLKKP